MKRSFDPVVFRKAVEPYPGIITEDFDYEGWVADKKNVMYEEDGSVGLATHDYPGAYAVHWFFKVRGKDALLLARKMLTDLFENHGAKIVRGITREDLIAARMACKKIGFKSAGMMEDGKAKYEFFTLREEDLEKVY